MLRQLNRYFTVSTTRKIIIIRPTILLLLLFVTLLLLLILLSIIIIVMIIACRKFSISQNSFLSQVQLMILPVLIDITLLCIYYVYIAKHRSMNIYECVYVYDDVVVVLV